MRHPGALAPVCSGDCDALAARARVTQEKIRDAPPREEPLRCREAVTPRTITVRQRVRDVCTETVRTCKDRRARLRRMRAHDYSDARCTTATGSTRDADGACNAEKSPKRFHVSTSKIMTRGDVRSSLT